MAFRLRVESRPRIRELLTVLRDLFAVDWKELHEEMGMAIQANVAERFRTETDPDEQAWKPRKKARKERDSKGRYLRGRGRRAKLLQDTGRLRSSIDSRATEEYAEVGSSVVYAARHNFGFEKDGKELTPARPFLGMGRSTRRDLDEAINDFLESMR